MTASRRRKRFLNVAAGVATLFALCVAGGGAETTSSEVHVTLSSPETLSLHVTLRSNADKAVTFYKYRLPWGNRNSMVLVAVTPTGQYLDRDTPIDDPSPERIAVKPGEPLSGDVSLEKNFRGLRSALKKSDIHLFWAYEAPAELNIERWSGGWVLIPKQK